MHFCCNFLSASSFYVLIFFSLLWTSFEQLFTKCWSWGSLSGIWYNSNFDLIICTPNVGICSCISSNIGLKICRSLACYGHHRHKIGWVRKVAHPVLLSKGPSELTYLWKNTPMYVCTTVHLIESLCCAISDIELNLLQYNFVGRLLGPRGNSLKRVELNTECRVLIRGRGSIKDPARVRMRVHYVSQM